MASHKPFGHLQHKLWSKERPGVKLAVWLPTTKSQEPTRSRCVQVDCDTPLESSQGELQVRFRPCPNRRLERKVMNAQSPRSLNRDNLETPLGSLGTKSHLGVGAVEQHREYYMGEGDGFPRVWAVVCPVSPCCLWLVLTPRVFSKGELTLLWLVLDAGPSN
jgi:hypothetical protein